MRILTFLTASLILGLALVASPASANEAAKQLYLGYAEDFVTDLVAAESVLKSKDPSEWTQEEIEFYLFNALFAVYFANNAYMSENYTHPYDSDVLRGTGLISKWPENPFNNWEPMEWIESTSEFVPGGLVKQLCPPHLYSGRTAALVPRTYAMSIIGPSEDFSPSEPVENFFDWSTVPQGTAFMTGSLFQSYEETLANLRMRNPE